MLKVDLPTIPHAEAPQVLPCDRFIECGEPFVKVVDNDFICLELKYHQQGIPAAVDECYMRAEVYQRLYKASKQLPDGYKFRVFDAWRPFDVQYYLYESFRQKFSAQHPKMDEEELATHLMKYVSIPKKTTQLSPVHCSGGAVDISIQDNNGVLLDMGTEFDCFEETASIRYFEDRNEEVAYNRRLLYYAMTSAGFTNFPSEWWHYDYGTRFWAYYTNGVCRYGGVYTTEELKITDV